eukprot:CAMPEP_0168486506 /NCGR_PEP_ID=MMETSP0228-20121227/67153_1 /TAXON_ID=133427 /ORGANISM="Protoceratium reticulatum, Strain CCCM 535 (=CCMP 1889)" /LENGTH=44 /DNA_ID= /DNA_START= /DNA_END= /DNA_ORIENTATION=
MKHPLTGYCSISSDFWRTCSYQPGTSFALAMLMPPPLVGLATTA